MNEIISAKALASFFKNLFRLARNEGFGGEMLCGDSLDLSYISYDILPQLLSPGSCFNKAES